MDYYFWKWGGWVWIGKRWFYLCYEPDYTPLFSERYGYTKLYRFAGFVFKTKTRKP